MDITTAKGIMDRRARGEKIVGAELDEFNAHVMASAPEIGSEWEHHLGGRYVVRFVGLDPETLVPLVGYEALSLPNPGMKWVRPLVYWKSIIKTVGPDGTPTSYPRYRLISPAPPRPT